GGNETLALSPNGKFLASGRILIHFYEVANGKERFQWWDHNYWVRCLAFSKDGRFLLSGGFNNSVAVRDVASGKVVRRLEAPADCVHCIAFSPDGKLLAGSTGGVGVGGGIHPDEVILWKFETGKVIGGFPGHRGNIKAIAFSPSGKTLATAEGYAEDHIVRLWDLTSGKELWRVVGLKAPVNSLAFAPDGKTLATASTDKTIVLWEVGCHKPRWVLKGHRDKITCVVFGRDGSKLASGSDDKTAIVWYVGQIIAAQGVRAHGVSPQRFEELWNDLSGDDAFQAYKAVWALAATPKDVLSLLEKEVTPKALPNPSEVAQLIAQLDSNSFSAREQATAQLGKLGVLAQPALVKTLQGPISLEVRRRIELLLKSENLRLPRAVEVLEHIGTLEARNLLLRLANAAPEKAWANDAKASAERLPTR